MAKIHSPHRKSGYITSIDFEQTTDQDGRPDWLMHYTPGPKAKAEYRAFTRRGGPQVLDIEEQPSLALPLPEPTPLERELIDRGVTASTARELVAAYPEERIAAQIECFDWLREHGPKKVQANPGGYLSSAIRGDYARPQGFESRAERAKRREAEEAKRRREQEEARRRKAEQARERAAQVKTLDYWNGLSPEEQASLEAEALEQADETLAATYREMQAKRNPVAPMCLKHIREAHIRKLLGIASPSPLPQ